MLSLVSQLMPESQFIKKVTHQLTVENRIASFPQIHCKRYRYCLLKERSFAIKKLTNDYKSTIGCSWFIEIYEGALHVRLHGSILRLVCDGLWLYENELFSEHYLKIVINFLIRLVQFMMRDNQLKVLIALHAVI